MITQRYDYRIVNARFHALTSAVGRSHIYRGRMCLHYCLLHWSGLTLRHGPNLITSWPWLSYSARRNSHDLPAILSQFRFRTNCGHVSASVFQSSRIDRGIFSALNKELVFHLFDPCLHNSTNRWPRLSNFSKST
jgi:hypothetical protein